MLTLKNSNVNMAESEDGKEEDEDAEDEDQSEDVHFPDSVLRRLEGNLLN